MTIRTGQAVLVATKYAAPLSSISERLARPSRRQVATISHGQHVPTLTAAAALRVKAARPGDLDLFDLESVSESRVTWDPSVPILAFLGLPVLDLGPMYATVRQTSGSIIA